MLRIFNDINLDFILLVSVSIVDSKSIPLLFIAPKCLAMFLDGISFISPSIELILRSIRSDLLLFKEELYYKPYIYYIICQIQYIHYYF